MGSVAVGDVVSDLTRFPHSMMLGGHHDQSSAAGSERHHHSSSADGSVNAPRRSSAHQHHSSTSSTSQRSDGRRASGSGAREAPQNTAPTPPIDVPGRSRAQRSTPNREEAEEDDKSETDETPRMNTNEPHEQSHEGEEVNYGASPPSPQLRPTIRSTASLTNSGSPPRIVVRNLNHIQSFASEEVLTRSRQGSRRSLRGRMEGSQQYEISSMPVTDIIEMVAGLLTKITTTNDRPGQHENIHRHLPNSESTVSASHLQTQSVLSFHGRNIPSITILSYLSRIHRYCPTTYEVFLSLLVYFDRMTEAVNNGTLRSFRSVEEAFGGGSSSSGNSSTGNNAASSLQTPPASGSVPPQDSDHESSLVDSDDEPEERPNNHVFVVDSYNIHRLVIAGVTCASKFFSDVFYTNSRYAKVGGLPIHELNHLELQFLLLNDFRLSVPVEELEAYGSRLVEFYAREVVAQQSGNGNSHGTGQGHGHGHDALYMQNQGSSER